MSLFCRSVETVRQRELELGLNELLDVWSADILGFDFSNLDDLDGSESCAVTSGHILIAGLDGVASGKFAVLFVHVVRSRARVVADPDSKVLDDIWSLLEYL